VIMVPLDMCCTTSGLWYSRDNIIIIFPTEVSLRNFLVFWWAGLVPFLVQPLHFRLQVLHSSFIWSHCGCQEACHLYHYRSSWHMSTHLSSILGVICGHTVELNHIMDNVLSWTMIDVQHRNLCVCLNTVVSL